MAEDQALVPRSMPAPLKSPLPMIRSVVEAGAVAQDVSTTIVRDEVDDAGAASEDASVPQTQHKVSVCRFFLNGANCRFGSGCRFLHSWWSGTDDLVLVKALEGHKKPITGIALPSGSKYLYSSCIETVRTWDCDTGQCVEILRPGCRIGCLVSLGDEAWTLLGFPCTVKASNSQSGLELSLYFRGGKRQVYALVLGSVNGQQLLFAGLSNGSILVWNWDAAANTFERVLGVRASSLARAHFGAVRTLVVGNGFLYSGSMDHQIKVWDLSTLLCIQTLTDHTDAVTSIICWGQYMLSGSLDGTVRVWSVHIVDTSQPECIGMRLFNPKGFQFESTYMHKLEASVVALGGMHDSSCRPVLMCSCDDFCVYLYHLPSFVEVGCIFSGDEIRHIRTGPNGLFFTGNASGDLKVWKWKAGN